MQQVCCPLFKLTASLHRHRYSTYLPGYCPFIKYIKHHHVPCSSPHDWRSDTARSQAVSHVIVQYTYYAQQFVYCMNSLVDVSVCCTIYIHTVCINCKFAYKEITVISALYEYVQRINIMYYKVLYSIYQCFGFGNVRSQYLYCCGTGATIFVLLRL